MIAPQEAIRTIKSITAKEIYRLYTQIKKCGVDVRDQGKEYHRLYREQLKLF